MSLFGEMIRLTPDVQIPAEVKSLLEGILEEAGMKYYDEMVKELYERLDVAMFVEILTYLPARHLDTFVKMNQQESV
jgi:hypothetical protein